MKLFLSVLLALAAPLCLASSILVNLESIGNLRNDSGVEVGFAFVVGDVPITVTELGRWVVPGNTEAHVVKLRDNNSQLVASVSVNTSGAGVTPNTFSYQALSSPVVLAANSRYFLLTAETNGGDQWSDYNSIISVSAAANLVGSCYKPGPTADVVIANTGSYSYGPVNIKYSTGSEQSLPVISGLSVTAGTVGAPFNANIQASGSPTSFTLVGGALPSGLNLGSGVITGTPLSVGTYNFTLAGTNALGVGTPAAIQIVISAAPQAPAASVQNVFSITNTAGMQSLLMGNQDAAGANNPSILRAANGDFQFGHGSSWQGSGGTFTPNVIFANNGNVGIGTANPTYKLAVLGTIRATQVIVETGWSDYVFAENYRLAPLSEVEAHIKTHQHLEGIPSAKDVMGNGVSIGEMQSKLLAKVEELTLYLIAQQKELSAIKRENAALQQQLDRLSFGAEASAK